MTETHSKKDPTGLAWSATALFVPLILGLITQMGAIDLAYHLRTGTQILSELSLPHFDTYTFSVEGTRWVDQQWGAQVVLVLVFRLGGWPTLNAFQAVLGAASFIFVFDAARCRGATPRTAAVLTLIGVLLASPMITLRPQLVALPFLAAALWALATRARAPWRVWLLPPLAVIVANLHGSFILLPLIAGLALLEDVIADKRGGRTMFGVVLITLLATLINPFGTGAWVYALDLSTNPVIRDEITEWAPLTLGKPLGVATIASAMVISGFFARRSRPVEWIDLLTLGLFFALALSASRAVLWWAMVAPIVVSGQVPGAPKRPDGAETQGSSRGPAVVLVAGLVAVAIALLPWWRGPAFSRHLAAAPPGVTEALKDFPPGTRIMAHQQWGSWFIYAVPDSPVFVDSRIEIVPPEIWEDYFQIAFAGARWRDVLDRWKPDVIVADREHWEITPLLRSDPSWRVAYEDGDGIIFAPAT